MKYYVVLENIYFVMLELTFLLLLLVALLPLSDFEICIFVTFQYKTLFSQSFIFFSTCPKLRSLPTLINSFFNRLQQLNSCLRMRFLFDRSSHVIGFVKVRLCSHSNFSSIIILLDKHFLNDCTCHSFLSSG